MTLLQTGVNEIIVLDAIYEEDNSNEHTSMTNGVETKTRKSLMLRCQKPIIMRKFLNVLKKLHQTTTTVPSPLNQNTSFFKQ